MQLVLLTCAAMSCEQLSLVECVGVVVLLSSFSALILVTLHVADDVTACTVLVVTTSVLNKIYNDYVTTAETSN